MEPPKRSGNSRQGRVVSSGSAESVELDALLSKLTSDNIEDRRSAAGENSNTISLCCIPPYFSALKISPNNFENWKFSTGVVANFYLKDTVYSFLQLSLICMPFSCESFLSICVLVLLDSGFYKATTQ